MRHYLLFLILFPTLIFAKAAPIRFAAIGDYGSNTPAEAVVAQKVKAYNPEFIITQGDNNYLIGCWQTIDQNIGKYYSDYIGNYKGKYGSGSIDNRFYPSLGNHDWYAVERSNCMHEGKLPYLDYFTLPGNGRYYDYIKGSVHFFVLDSDPHEKDGTTKNSKQYEWFKKNISQSISPFNIVYFHHASYSSSSHGDDKRMQWNFKELGADLVITGHDHSYERINRDGLTFIVNGIGGPHHLTGINKKTKGSQFFYSKKYGFMLITADNEKLVAQMINEDNEIIDEFSLVSSRPAAISRR